MRYHSEGAGTLAQILTILDLIIKLFSIYLFTWNKGDGWTEPRSSHSRVAITSGSDADHVIHKSHS